MECGDTASQGRVGIFAVAIGYQCKFDTVVRGVSVFIGDDDSIVAGVGFDVGVGFVAGVGVFVGVASVPDFVGLNCVGLVLVLVVLVFKVLVMLVLLVSSMLLMFLEIILLQEH